MKTVPDIRALSLKILRIYWYNDIDVEYNKNMPDNQEFSPSKIGENDSEEQILNQVIGEFLQ